MKRLHLEILPSGAYLICGEKDVDGLYDMRSTAVSRNGSDDDDVDYEAFEHLTVRVVERTLRYNGWQLSHEDNFWYGSKGARREEAEYLEELLEGMDVADLPNPSERSQGE